MPRPANIDHATLLDRAMHQFWRHGYAQSSIARLVAATGAPRQALHDVGGGKHGLFLAVIDHYADTVVTPALQAFERIGSEPRAARNALRGYFATQIALAERGGLPGPGCLIANSETEIAPHDAAVRDRVRAHHQRLANAFCGALRVIAPDAPAARTSELGACLAIWAQGFWSWSRGVADASQLRAHANTQLNLIERSLQP